MSVLWGLTTHVETVSELCDIIATVLDAVVLLVVHDVEYILVYIRKVFFALVKVANKKIKFREMLFI